MLFGIPDDQPRVLSLSNLDVLNVAHPLGPVNIDETFVFVKGLYIVRFSIVGGPKPLNLSTCSTMAAPITGS